MKAYCTGMDRLVDERMDLLEGRRVALVCHPASMNRLYTHSSVLLRERIGDRLACLMGPEHGFFGRAPAGEQINNDVHPEWRIPILSLYGDEENALTRFPQHADVVVFDLQDLAVRCYTYVHTLRRVMEAAAKHGLPMIVADRPAPFVARVDGPMLQEQFESIIAPVPAPLVYGMTPGETARWLCAVMAYDLDLTVVPARGYTRRTAPSAAWPDWTPPSPAIRSWACAVAYPATVYTEALPQLDCARSTNMAFRVLRAEWLDAAALTEALQARDLPGVLFAPYHDVDGPALPGVQMRVTDVTKYQPIATGVTWLYEIQRIHGAERIWRDERTRPDWFDRLMGTDRVRLMLQDGELPDVIAAEWAGERAEFMPQRAAALLYGD